MIIMRMCDVLLAFPGILLAIGIIAILGPGLRQRCHRSRDFQCACVCSDCP